MSRYNNIVPVSANSHHKPLLDCLALTTGPVLELGAGNHSTQFLHDACGKSRLLLTLDNNADWLERWRGLAGHYHELRSVEDWRQPDKWRSRHWGVALVDTAPPESRGYLAVQLAPICDFIVVHDTDCREYAFDTALMTFRWRKEYRDELPFSTVVSNRREIP